MLPGSVMAEQAPAGDGTQSTGQIYAGSIPAGDGTVAVKAESGKLYQVPVMSPLGVIQALAGTDLIESYSLGDELMAKRGILTLDGINSNKNSGDTGWTVSINEIRLQDMVLPDSQGLNRYTLHVGDKVIFSYGNPTKPLSEAVAFISITIGASNNSGATVPDTNTTVLEPIPAPVPTEKLVEIQINQSTDRDPNEPVFEGMPSKSEEKSDVKPVGEVQQTTETGRDPNLPIPEELLDEYEETTPEETSGEVIQQKTKTTRDPNLPVPEELLEELEATPDETPVETVKLNQDTARDPNLPIPEEMLDELEATPDENPTKTEKLDTGTARDPNLPVPEEMLSEYEQSTQNQTEINPPVTVEPTPEETQVRKSDGQERFFNGTVSLPSGTANITASSGSDYDISMSTPVGLLQSLVDDGKLSTIEIDDTGMRKGGILTIESINGYSRSDMEVWFVQVNDLTLNDWYKPETDGLNLKRLTTGDVVGYYYGNPASPISGAKASIVVTLE